MLFSRSRCILSVACTAYMTSYSIMTSINPDPVAEFGPRTMNMFGNWSTHIVRYVTGCGRHRALSSAPPRPTILKGSWKDVSYPVAQNMMSRSWCAPSTVSMPRSVIRLMGVLTKSTLSSTKASR